ncbi:autophagy-related protein 27 [Microdochium trichocladiopsis]|uniref:Autophagy-related protein 27 n=1 Tax=Microdochium trichocladiopsis TaxID=1682393 RepID=A0A9P8YIZ2_9PEZI|nr:autophagy-related protein 27 [Microdochium trichocladiopsis]KAH7039895.1 autophagy-related protein 27 [Microdochium trichocladiopsis]
MILPLLSFLLATPAAAAASTSWCNRVLVDGRQYNLEKLGGPHSVVVSNPTGATLHNTTYTLDLCKPLVKSGDGPKEERCPDGTRVCAISRLIGKVDNKVDVISAVIPIAGDLAEVGGHKFEPKTKLLVPEAEEGAEGLHVTLSGGTYTFEDGRKHDQRAVVRFVCDEKREGTEGEYESEDKYDTKMADIMHSRRRDDDSDDDGKKKEFQLGDLEAASLLYDSYGPSQSDSDVDVLRLTWKTKYACASRSTDPLDPESPGEGNGDEGGAPPNNSWGFFTWFIILVFFGTAAYLIFGSWLNYTRYGARGWDLLPHGDSIRDVPYLLKDWLRRALNTVQGSGSRGGYSAV